MGVEQQLKQRGKAVFRVCSFLFCCFVLFLNGNRAQMHRCFKGVTVSYPNLISQREQTIVTIRST